MGVKLMTGATGEQNIQAADDRECLAGITGLDSYVFPTGSQLKATLVDANTVTIGTGAGSLQGSRFRCSTTTTVNIQSGTQGQFRNDIVGLHFSRETSGREGLEFQVLTGEPAASEGAAADPAYTAGDLLKGDAEAFMPLYRVKLSGINASDPEPMFNVLTPLATLGDSVSRSTKYKVKTFGPYTGQPGFGQSKTESIAELGFERTPRIDIIGQEWCTVAGITTVSNKSVEFNINPTFNSSQIRVVMRFWEQ